MTSLRRRLYGVYVSSHLGTYRDISLDAFRQDRRIFEAHLARHLPADRQAPILDLGCGYGSFLHYLSRKGYGNAQGVDVSEEQIAAARRLGVERAQVAEAAAFLEARPGAFDLIVALDFFEHFSKDEVLHLLDCAREALRPGGRLILRVPNGDSPFASWIRYADFTHELMFTPASVRQVLRAAGFTPLGVYPLEPVVHGPASLARWLLWKGVKQLARLYLLIEQGTIGSGVFTSNLLAMGRRN